MKNENQGSKLESVLSKFKITKSLNNHHQAVCPAHDDGTASLTITEEVFSIHQELNSDKEFQNIFLKKSIRRNKG